MDRSPSLDNLDSLDGHAFENLVEDLLRKMGYSVHGRSRAADGGIDMLAESLDPITGGKYVVQCKRYSQPVGVAAVRDLFGVVTAEGANRGILLTTARFTPDALRFAEGKPLGLIDRAQLEGLFLAHAVFSGHTDQVFVAPGMRVAYAVLFRPLTAAREQIQRMRAGLVHIPKKPELDYSEYGRAITRHSTYLDTATKSLASLLRSMEEGLNDQDPSENALTTLRRSLAEIVRITDGAVAIQRDIQTITPPAWFEELYAEYHMAIVTEFIDSYFALASTSEAAVQGNASAGEHGLRFDFSQHLLLAFLHAIQVRAAEFKDPGLGGTGETPGTTCFVATVVYGAEHRSVRDLRYFRDTFLLPNAAGRRLVTMYYVASPPIARAIGRRKMYRAIVRAALRPIVAFVRVCNAAASARLTPVGPALSRARHGIGECTKRRAALRGYPQAE